MTEEIELKYSYNPEGQAGGVRQGFERNDLYRSDRLFQGYEVEEEEGQDWVLLHNGEGRNPSRFLMDSNFNFDLLRKLKIGDLLTEVASFWGIVRDGRFPNGQPIALVTFKDEELYRSPQIPQELGPFDFPDRESLFVKDE